MSFQNHKTFGKKYFDEIWEISVPPLTVSSPKILMLQDVCKEIKNKSICMKKIPVFWRETVTLFDEQI